MSVNATFKYKNISKNEFEMFSNFEKLLKFNDSYVMFF